MSDPGAPAATDNPVPFAYESEVPFEKRQAESARTRFFEYLIHEPSAAYSRRMRTASP